jgi:hypothetical protein
VCPDYDFSAGLYAASLDAVADAPLAQIDVIVTWDPAEISLLGNVDDGPHTWLFSGFPDDSAGDGLNDTFADGDALYRAVAVDGDPALATPAGLRVTRFDFQSLVAGAEVQIVMQPTAGSATVSRVLSADVVDLDVLSSLDEVAVILSDPGDMNCNGTLNGFDIDPFVIALTDPAAYATMFPDCTIWNADANCDGVINGFDIDPFVILLTGGD